MSDRIDWSDAVKPMTDEIATLRVKVAELECRIEGNNTIVEYGKRAIAEASDRIRRHEERVEELERENAGLKSDCVLSTHAYDMLKAERDGLHAENDSRKRYCAELVAKNDRLKIIHCNRDEMIESMKRLTAERDSLAAALKTLIERLDVVHSAPKYQSVWMSYMVHGGNYTEPTYTRELANARTALDGAKDALAAHDAEKDAEIERLGGIRDNLIVQIKSLQDQSLEKHTEITRLEDLMLYAHDWVHDATQVCALSLAWRMEIVRIRKERAG